MAWLEDILAEHTDLWQTHPQYQQNIQNLITAIKNVWDPDAANYSYWRVHGIPELAKDSILQAVNQYAESGAQIVTRKTDARNAQVTAYTDLANAALGFKDFLEFFYDADSGKTAEYVSFAEKQIKRALKTVRHYNSFANHPLRNLLQAGQTVNSSSKDHARQKARQNASYQQAEVRYDQIFAAYDSAFSIFANAKNAHEQFVLSTIDSLGRKDSIQAKALIQNYFANINIVKPAFIIKGDQLIFIKDGEQIPMVRVNGQALSKSSAQWSGNISDISKINDDKKYGNFTGLSVYDIVRMSNGAVSIGAHVINTQAMGIENPAAFNQVLLFQVSVDPKEENWVFNFAGGSSQRSFFEEQSGSTEENPIGENVRKQHYLMISNIGFSSKDGSFCGAVAGVAQFSLDEKNNVIGVVMDLDYEISRRFVATFNGGFAYGKKETDYTINVIDPLTGNSYGSYPYVLKSEDQFNFQNFTVHFKPLQGDNANKLVFDLSFINEIKGVNDAWGQDQTTALAVGGGTTLGRFHFEAKTTITGENHRYGAVAGVALDKAGTCHLNGFYNYIEGEQGAGIGFNWGNHLNVSVKTNFDKDHQLSANFGYKFDNGLGAGARVMPSSQNWFGAGVSYPILNLFTKKAPQESKLVCRPFSA
ncbi:MAG TPA: hypothetical protein PLO93_06250, partial [Candidatus Omnitrophota bacterium]|nr:hypothetical protein [Candidatus Omnitrophota bacterium]